MILKLDPSLRPADYGPVFRKFGRIHIPGILDPAGAVALEQRLRRFDAWTRALTVGDPGDGHAVLDPDGLDAEGVCRVERVVTPPGQTDIRFLFDMHSIATVRPRPGVRDPRLIPIGDFINGPGFLDFARSLTGDDRIRRCDASATRYMPGHYLTPHNDANAGEERLYAYVLNLSRSWKVEWGGVLAFIDADGHVAEGYTPVFNSLNIFRVPQNHTVTMVNALARVPRLAVTGWMHGPGSTAQN
ncbi:2OG-Fe(II) oxygenase [Brevundimonas sp. R86498]|uniref:2OG-Fe(II) oxygenase n=1 Tax=Brevundimonas sp. R86498 TaxID=3093845 RepID=UPI0037C61069